MVDDSHNPVLVSKSNPTRYNSIIITIAIVVIVWGMYYRLLIAVYGVSTPQADLFQKVTDNLYNPNYVNFDESYQTPSSDHPFGTDFLGRDVYSRIVFGLGFMIMYILYTSLSRIVLAAFYLRLRPYMPDNVHKIIHRIFGSIPRIILLLFLSFVLNDHIRAHIQSGTWFGSPGLIFFILLTSVFFWGDTYEILQQSSEGTEKSRRNRIFLFFKILFSTIAMVLVEFIVISFLGLFSFGSLSLGSDLGFAVYNNPSEYTWRWIYPLTIIVVLYGLFSTVGSLLSPIYLQPDNRLYPDSNEEEIFLDNRSS